jgi:prenylcysteine oxidase/farnesylcysteine lyase
MAIYDGSTFVYSGTESCGYICGIKMWWRYGRSPLKVSSLVSQVVADFNRIYSNEFVRAGPYDSIEEFARAAELHNASSMTGLDYFGTAGISELFTREIIGAAVRVNYGQNVDRIHSLGAMVSLAAQGARSVIGGNKRIFQQFAERSGCKVRLGTKVVKVVKLDAGFVNGGGTRVGNQVESSDGSSSTRGGRGSPWIVKAESAGDGPTSEVFDSIIIAAPFKLSGIEIHNSLASKAIPHQDYVHLHVTFVITNATSPSSSYFNTTASIPTSIFSTFSTTTSAPKPIFNSLNYLKRLLPATTARFSLSGDAYVVKLFSASELDDEIISSLFGGGSNVARIQRKNWNAYPILDPVSQEKPLGRVRIDDAGLYYINAFEPLISTMETEVSRFIRLSESLAWE